jgi:hypothetical protein
MMRALLIPADDGKPVRSVWLPPFQGWARRVVRRLAPGPHVQVGTDRGAFLDLHSHPLDAVVPFNRRAEALTLSPVYGDAVLVAVVRVKYEGDLLVSVSRKTRAMIAGGLTDADKIELTDSHAAL